MICTQYTQQLATDPTGLGLIALESGQVFGQSLLCSPKYMVDMTDSGPCTICNIGKGQDVFDSIQSPPIIVDVHTQKVSFIVLHIEWFPSGREKLIQQDFEGDVISGFFDAPILLLICIAFCGVSLLGCIWS